MTPSDFQDSSKSEAMRAENLCPPSEARNAGEGKLYPSVGLVGKRKDDSEKKSRAGGFQRREVGKGALSKPFLNKKQVKKEKKKVYFNMRLKGGKGEGIPWGGGGNYNGK